MAELDVLESVPSDVEVLCDVLDGRVRGESERVAFEGVGVGTLGVGKVKAGLQRLGAGVAEEALHGDIEEDGLAADGQRFETSWDDTRAGEAIAAAGGAGERGAAGAGVEDDGSVDE